MLLTFLAEVFVTYFNIIRIKTVCFIEQFNAATFLLQQSESPCHRLLERP